LFFLFITSIRKGLKIRKGLIEKEQTTQWPKKNIRTNNDLKNTIRKIKDLATRTPLKPGVKSRVSGMFAVPAPPVTPVYTIYP